MTPLYFISGASRPSDLRGLVRISAPLGVSIPELSDHALAELLAAAPARPLLQVFVDSGAFSEVDRTGRIVAPITLAAWRTRVAVMLRIAAAFGPRCWIVAPDCVGNQGETLTRLRAFAAEMRQARALGARVIVPIQRGDMPPASFDRAAAEVLSFSDFVRGIPGNKIAMPAGELEAFLRTRRPAAVHLLGIGPRGRRFRPLVDLLRRLVPGAAVSCDSQAFSAQTGRTNGAGGEPRALTSWQDHFEGRPSTVAQALIGDPRRECSREAAIVMTFGPKLWFERMAGELAKMGVRLDGFERVGDGLGVRGFEPPAPKPPLQMGLFDGVEGESSPSSSSSSAAVAK